MFCEKCGGMISNRLCNCNRPDPPSKDDIPDFPRNELRDILYNCGLDRKYSVKSIASKWALDEETTHNILWFLETINRVAGGNYYHNNRVYIRTRERNYDLEGQISAATRFIQSNFDDIKDITPNKVFYMMRNQGFNIHKKAVRIAYIDLERGLKL